MIGTDEQRAQALAIARGVLRRLPPWVLREDIEQAALIGLWKALLKDGDGHTAKQRAAYIKRRVRGAIFDELRAQDWAPRRKEASAERPTLVHLDDVAESEQAAVPQLESREPSPALVAQHRHDAARALDAPMNPTDRRVVELVLLRGGLCTDAARALQTSEPRVHQRLQRALHTMRAWIEGDTSVQHRQASHAYRVPLHARQTIWKKHEDDQRTHRANRIDPGRASTEPAVSRSVRGRGLGGPPASATARPLPGRAGRAELGRQARARLPGAARLVAVRPAPEGSGMNAKSWAEADANGHELRLACARLRLLRMSNEQIAAKLHTLPEVVELVLNTPAPLRKCGP